VAAPIRIVRFIGIDVRRPDAGAPAFAGIGIPALPAG
jgi:hypothetical protein